MVERYTRSVRFEGRLKIYSAIGVRTNRHCQAVGCSDAVEAHKRYSPVDNFNDKALKV